jgi:DNA-binding transcriptional LysR family regulator
MQIESLKVFCDLIDTRSFSKAGARNSISQSAVSQQVRALEERYGRRLIVRSRRGLAPTEAGIAFYQGCRAVLDEYATLSEEMAGVGTRVSGSVRVATVYSVGLYGLPAFIKQFIRSYPEVNIHLEYSRPNKVYEDLINGTIDLGIVANPVTRPQIEVVPLWNDPLVVICSPEHRLAAVKRIDVSRLNGERFIGFEHDVPTRKALDRLLRDHGVSVQYAMEFDNIETIKRSIEVDQGISIVPRITVENEVKAGTLKALRLPSQFTRSVGIIHRKGKVFSAAAQRFIQTLARSNNSRA